VDCNAIAPSTTKRVGEIVGAAGALFVDAGIIGGPPRGKVTPRIYASGPHAAELAQLEQFGLKIPVIGDSVGQASGLKMCYAGMTKGLQALATELLVTAKVLGLEDELRAEMSGSQAPLRHWFERSIPGMPPKAHRWVGEMEEIAKTYSDAGMTDKILLGAADMYRWIATTPLGHETPESRDAERSLDEVIAALADTLTPTAANR